MKKIVSLGMALLLALALLCPALADVPDKPSGFAYAYDFSGTVLDSGDQASIAEYGEALETQTDVQAIAVVVDFLDGMEAGDYATDLINEWGIGSGSEDNGVVVLLARGDREIFIGTGKGIDRKLTGSKCGELIDENIGYFADNQFDKGMVALYMDVCEYIARVEGKTLFAQKPASAYPAAANSGNKEQSGSSLFDVILGIIIAYIVISVVINAVFRGKSCCLKMFFMGWLFDKKDRRDPKPPTPPMQTRHTPTYTPPMGGGFGTPRSTGGLFGPTGGHIGGYKGTHGGYRGGSLFGGSAGRSSAGRSTTSRSTTRSTFGGGSSRGGGAGRSFGSSMSKGGFGSSSRSSFGSSRSSFGSSRSSFGGGRSRGGGGGRKF